MSVEIGVSREEQKACGPKRRGYHKRRRDLIRAKLAVNRAMLSQWPSAAEPRNGYAPPATRFTRPNKPGKKTYGPSVRQGLSEQKTSDAAVGVFLDAQVHIKDASPSTVRKWRRALDKRAENERLARLRETIG